tara:strand:+ start:235 stop:396 length:162 start_codon:yes stop_codon:yes gene_type:complete
MDVSILEIARLVLNRELGEKALSDALDLLDIEEVEAEELLKTLNDLLGVEVTQ